MSTDRLVVIGGDAAGLSAAAQARRLRGAADLEIVVLEQGPEVSYSACGIPYWIGGLVSDRDRLIARTPEQFAAQDIVVRTDTRAEGIDLAAGEVVRGRRGAARLRQPRRRHRRPARAPDGARAWTPTACTACTGWPTAPTSAPRSPPGRSGPSSSGGGYIGLEMAEVLQTRGLHVTVVLADPLPMAQLDDDMGERVCAAMCDMGIDVQTGQPVREIEVDADGAVRAVRTDAGSYERRPRRPRARHGAGGDARPRGRACSSAPPAPSTSAQTQRSRSHPEVFAAGDCAQTFHRLTGEAIHVALGTHANKQGRVAGLGDRRPRRRGSPASSGRR